MLGVGTGIYQWFSCVLYGEWMQFAVCQMQQLCLEWQECACTHTHRDRHTHWAVNIWQGWRISTLLSSTKESWKDPGDSESSLGPVQRKPQITPGNWPEGQHLLDTEHEAGSDLNAPPPVYEISSNTHADAKTQHVCVTEVGFQLIYLSSLHYGLILF